MAANHGATSTTDAMTDPRPRVTNKIGNAQQTSVVSVVVNPTNVLRRSVRISPSQWAGWTGMVIDRAESDQTRSGFGGGEGGWSRWSARSTTRTGVVNKSTACGWN